MKRAFIRGLWGIYDKSHRLLNRRYSVDNDINNIINCKFNEPFIAYVVGRENYNTLISKDIEKFGHTCKCIHEEPFMFDLIKFQYRHKMEIIKYAMEVDDYDEVVYLDWDCIPQKKLLPTFWEDMKKRADFQACLQIYRAVKCPWRKEAKRQVPNGGFMYFGDKKIPAIGIKFWEGHQQDNDEPAWALMIDDWMGGWKGQEAYWNKYEAMYCNLHKNSAHPIEKVNTKDIYFMHYQG